VNPIHRFEIAGVVAVALLLGFQSVVRQAVRQGEDRREAMSQLALATAECIRIPRRAAREGCRERLQRDGAAPGAGRQTR
jgi:hypothetical protein